jgi:Putative transposase
VRIEAVAVRPTKADRRRRRTIASTVRAAGRRCGFTPHEFIHRFLSHVLPKGFQRIRQYGLFANANRAENIATGPHIPLAPPSRLHRMPR